MKRIVLIFGSIAGVIVGGMFLATWPLHENGILTPENGMLVGYTTMVIGLSLIFFGVKSYRDNHLHGVISFGKALVLGLCISFVAAIIYALTWEIMYNTIASDYLKEWADYSIEKMKKAGASSEEILAEKKEMADMFEWYKNPILRFGMTMAEILPVGIFISLICAALLRKKKFLPSSNEK